MLLSIPGTDSDIADKYYTHVGEEAQQQAIAAISDIKSNQTAQDKINNVLEILDLIMSYRNMFKSICIKKTFVGEFEMRYHRKGKK